jgi:hypothetical protein
MSHVHICAFQTNIETKAKHQQLCATMDSCTAEAPPPSNTTKKCNKNGCNIRIPLDYRYRRCDKCRATNRQNQKDSRARAAATAANANTSGTTSKKRRRASLGSADGRPATRPRTDHSCEDDSNTRDVDQEDSDDDICGDYKEDKNRVSSEISLLICF